MRPRAAALALLLATGAAQDPPAPLWSVNGLKNPESAFADPQSGFLFVSQVDGSPGEKDGRGFIAKLTLDGRLLQADWVSGLHAPKGLRAFQGTLWTADIDTLVGIEIASGKILHRVPVPGAKFLNDVACGPDGAAYVSDMLAPRLHRFLDGRLSTVAEGEETEYPNGLLWEGGGLVVAGWGKPAEDFSTKTPGRLYRLDPASGKKTLITPQPLGNLDGLESDGRGGFLVTEWTSGKVFHVTAGGEARVLLRFKPGTADHAYLPARKLLILPHMNEGRVAAYDLSGLLP